MGWLPNFISSPFLFSSLTAFSTIIQVAEVRKQADILESYLEQRGIALPEGYISCKVILPNPKLWYDFESSRIVGMNSVDFFF